MVLTRLLVDCVAMRVHLDAGTCTGHGRCYALAPSLFAPDDDGYGTLVGDGTIDAASAELARRAATNCPERAITVEE